MHLTKWILVAVGGVLSLNAGAASFEDYQTPEGFVTGSQHPTEPAGNSLLFTSEKMVYVATRGLQTWKDGEDFDHLLSLCQVQPGLYRRTPAGKPFSQDAEAQDDYIGISAAAYLLNRVQASSIYTYGITHDWNFSLTGHNDFPRYWDWEAWFGRSPAFVAHVKWAAGMNPSYFQRWAWALSVLVSGVADPQAQDPWILTWLMVKTMNHRSWLGDQAAKVWEWRLKRQWGSLENVFARYFNDPNHPLAQQTDQLPCPKGMNPISRSTALVLKCQPD